MEEGRQLHLCNVLSAHMQFFEAVYTARCLVAIELLSHGYKTVGQLLIDSRIQFVTASI